MSSTLFQTSECTFQSHVLLTDAYIHHSRPDDGYEELGTGASNTNSGLKSDDSGLYAESSSINNK